MTERDYRKEYQRDHSSLRAKKQRAMRNLWNRRLQGKVPDGMEIDHRTPLKSGGSNDRDNIRFRPISENRSDKSMMKSAFITAAVGAAGADEGVQNRAAGAAAGSAAGLATTPLGIVAGLEYLRARGDKHGVDALKGMSRNEMYSRAARNPIQFVKGLGVKGSAITTAGTYAVGIPAAYLAGKYVGRGYGNNPQTNQMQTKSAAYGGPGQIRMEYTNPSDAVDFGRQIRTAMESPELANIISASTNPYIKKQRDRAKRYIKNKLTRNERE